MNKTMLKDVDTLKYKGREFKMIYIDIIEDVISYYTYEEWKEKLKGCIPMDDNIINHSKKDVMYAFLRAYLKQYIVEVFTEMEKGNTVRFGKYLELRMNANKYFKNRFEFYNRFINVRFIGSFSKNIKYRYIAFITQKLKVKYFFQMLNHHKKQYNAKHFYNPRNSIS